MDTGLKKAVEAAGTRSALARSLGITAAAVLQWKKVPNNRILDVEKATGVPREILRPDLYRQPARRT